jgi:hypothetical protein
VSDYDHEIPVEGTPVDAAEVRQNFDGLRYGLPVNWMPDPELGIWPAGDSAAPAHLFTAGAGVAVARIGTGLADTEHYMGDWGAKITAGGGAVGSLNFRMLNSTSFPIYAARFIGEKVTLGAWVHSTDVDSVRLEIEDGDDATFSDYHTGVDEWQWLVVQHTVGASATHIRWRMNVAQSCVGRINVPTLFPGPVVPPDFIPCPSVIATPFKVYIPGETFTGNGVDYHLGNRPFRVESVDITAGTVPTGAAWIADLNHWDGSAWQSMFSTRPQLAISGAIGSAAPDGTYRYRCFAGRSGAITQTDVGMRFDVDQIGSTIKGSDVSIYVRARRFLTPLEDMWRYNEYGNV